MFNSGRYFISCRQLNIFSGNIQRHILKQCFSVSYFTKFSLLNCYGKEENNSHLCKYIHTFTGLQCKDNKDLLSFNDFHLSEKKDKKAFLEAIKLYQNNFPNKRGHLEFVESAMAQMKDFGVAEDLEIYKKLLNIFPKGPFLIKNRFELLAMRFPKQQMCVSDLLMQMGDYGVAPDIEVGEILKEVFGPNSRPVRQFKTLLYWSSKFKNKSPWDLPKQMTSDPFELAKLAINRITSVDVLTEISIFETADLPDSIDKTWIVSGQSPIQQKLLQKHPLTAPVVVEAGEVIWLRDKMVKYFILKADCEPFEYVPPKSKENLLEMESKFFNPRFTDPEEKELSVHEQDDGIIYAVCATGTSSKDSLLSWIRLLQQNGNPALGDLPVLFRFKEPEKSISVQPETINNAGSDFHL